MLFRSSGSTVDDQGGQHYRATTGPTLPISQSDSIYGRVLDGGNGPARNVLVTITVRAADGTAAAPMVSLIGPNDDGYWTSNLGNARAANGLSWFGGLANARVELSADGGELGKASTSLDLTAARGGVSVIKLDGKAPPPQPDAPTIPRSPSANPTATAQASSSVPAASAPVPAGGASSSGASSRPVVVPAGTIALPALPDGTSLRPNASLDAASQMPGYPAAPGNDAATTTQQATANLVPPRTAQSVPVGVDASVALAGTVPIGVSGAADIRLAGYGRATVAIDAPTRAALVRVGAVSMSIVFDTAPTLVNEVQAGSLGGGVVVPIGRPVDLRLSLSDMSGNEVRPTEDGTRVDVTLPVLEVPTGLSGTFTWLVATYDADGFAGYERPPADFDGTENRTTLSLSPSALQGTLFLPAVVVPAMVATLDSEARMWSNPRVGAVDLGPAGPRLTDLVVVAPQVRARLFVFNPLTENYGWIDAGRVGPA